MGSDARDLHGAAGDIDEDVARSASSCSV
jgi:hypothetical protein